MQKKVKKRARKDAKKSGTVIAKGTKLATIDENKNAQKDGSINTYDTNNSHAYTISASHASVMTDHGVNMYKHEYETTEDLIAPSEKVAVEAFSEAYNNNKKMFSESLNAIETHWKRELFSSLNVGGAIDNEMRWLLEDNAKYKVTAEREVRHRDSYKSYKAWRDALESTENYKNIFKGSFSSDKDLTDSEKRYAYLLYTYHKAGRAIDSDNHYSQNNTVDSAYMSSLTSKGYNAIVNNGTSSYFRAAQNVVAINGSTTLKEIDTYEMASDGMDAAVKKSLDDQRHRRLS